MLLDSRSKIRIGWIAAASAPLLAVQATHLLTGSGPRHAAAAAAQPAAIAATAVPAVSPAPPLTDEQLKALAWLAADAPDPAAMRSPMNMPQPPVSAAKPQPAPIDDPGMPHLRLGGVVSRGKDVVASINGRLFAEGDEPADGWTIRAMDSSARTVTLQRYDGMRVELSTRGMVELPRGE